MEPNSTAMFSRSGVELLKRFKEEFANFEKERQELANAEKLFGLSITLYPELLDMEKELKGLDQIFAIYENQKASQVFKNMLVRSRWQN